MKSLMTLAIFCFMFCVHTAFGQQKYKGFYKSDEVLLPWINIVTPANYLYFSTITNNTDLILNPVLYKDKAPKFGNSVSITSNDSYGTFSGKWERLMGKPIIDTSRLYFPTSKIKNNPPYHYSPLYRATATIFNFAVAVKYPYLNTSK